MKYQRHIDGLRALAVLSVIFYHAGFDIFKGGFIGVDVFFVISGYLITGIIIAQMASGNFFITNFYYRRVKRILPVLFFLLIFSLPFAWMLLSPADMIQFSKSLIGVSIFSSNILFWLQSGYFTNAADFNPFLHTWSLAVEEQFYLIFPVFCAIFIRKRRKFLLLGVLVLWSTSLLGSFVLSYVKPSVAFFLTPPRAWELLSGSLIALFYGNLNSWVKGSLLRSVHAFIGLLLISASVLVINKWVVFPGYVVLFPVVGTAMVILYTDEDTLVGKLLTSPFLVTIGLISFSAYLWHNLLFTFARFHGFAYSVPWAYFFLSVCSLGLAYFTWRYIEQPFRVGDFLTVRRAFIGSLVLSVLLISVGSMGVITGGFPARFSNKELELLEYRNYNVDSIYKRGSCFLEFGDPNSKFSDTCLPSSKDSPSFVIWGDSHAAALSFGLRNHFSNIGQFSRSSCPPVLSDTLNLPENCRSFNNMVSQEIISANPQKIFLHANWHMYDNDKLIDSVHATISYLNYKLPNSQIVIVGGVPQYPNTLPDYMVRKHVALIKGARLSTPLLDDLIRIDNSLANYSKNLNYTFVSPLTSLCESQGCLIVSQFDGEVMPMAFDYGHLTAAGSSFLAQIIIEMSSLNK